MFDVDKSVVHVDIGRIIPARFVPLSHEVRFIDDLDLHVGDEPVRVRRGTVMTVTKSTCDSVDVCIPVCDSVLVFNIQHSELFERFHPVTESA
jgi:hypothetical protein